jgi:uncharacterized beta barrel domain-containing protein DUF5777
VFPHEGETVTRITRLLFTLAAVFCIASSGFAQDDDAVLQPAEPDFTVINLPTSLRLPLFKSAFRVTHRFIRPLDCDVCPNSFWGDGFGTDEGAIIGLEYRFGIVPNGQVIAHRSRLDKSIQFMGEYGITRRKNGMPLEIAALASVEGTDNFTGIYSPAVGAAVTGMVGETLAVHIDPILVLNSNLLSDVPDNNTFYIGVGGRLRILSTVYVVGEISPRVAGFAPGKPLAAFGIEKRVGGHMFQLNFSNAFGTTLRQIAEGATDNHDWFLGFNISRKFF